MSKSELLKRLSAASFVAVDSQLFLDTHPKNKAALAVHEKNLKQARMLRDEYERRFGPLSPQDVYGDTSFEWVEGPWPWDRCFGECDN